MMVHYLQELKLSKQNLIGKKLITDFVPNLKLFIGFRVNRLPVCHKSKLEQNVVNTDLMRMQRKLQPPQPKQNPQVLLF